MPGVGTRIPDIEPVTADEILGIERTLWRLVAGQRVVEDFRVVYGLQQLQRAIIREQRKPARAQGRSVASGSKTSG
jgi:hypothetical protein